jgi:Ca2+/Na+ antiporter
MSALWFFVGLAALVVGAELLVRGASKLSLSFGVSPLLVGLTVVAFGTSAPEMAVSVQSAWVGQVNIAIGNVVGSNIFNILSVLGLSAVVAPSTLTVSPAVTVRLLMNDRPIALRETDRLRDAAEITLTHHFGNVPVCCL